MCWIAATKGSMLISWSLVILYSFILWLWTDIYMLWIKSIPAKDGLQFACIFLYLCLSVFIKGKNKNQNQKNQIQLLSVLWGGQGWCLWRRGWGKGHSCSMSRCVQLLDWSSAEEEGRTDAGQPGSRAPGHTRHGWASQSRTASATPLFLSPSSRTSLKARWKSFINTEKKSPPLLCNIFIEI